MAQSDVVLRRRALLLALLSCALAAVAASLVFLVDGYEEGAGMTLWSGGMDPSMLASEPASFLSFIVLPIVIISLFVVLAGKRSPVLMKTAVIAGLLVGALSVAEELGHYVANQFYFGIVPAALLCLGAFASAAALAQAANRSRV